MKKINQEIIKRMYELNSIISNVLTQINSINSHIYEDIGIILFYSIYETYFMNLNLFRDIDVNYDRAGYANAKRLTRTCIETYLDLYNYCNDSDYYEILKYNSRNLDVKYDTSQYERVIDRYQVGRYKDKQLQNLILNKFIMISDKINIAKKLHIDSYNLRFLIERKDEYNAFVHTNIKIMEFESYDDRIDSTKKLLRVNVFFLCDALDLIIKQYKLNLHPSGFYDYFLNMAIQAIDSIKDDKNSVFIDY